MHSEDGPATTPGTGRRRRRRWPWIVGGLVVVVVGIAVVAGVLGYQLYGEAKKVQADLTIAKQELAAIPQLISTGDQTAITASAQRALAATTRADKTVHGRLWSIGSAVPFIGQNVAAVRGATEATDILVRDALPAGLKLLVDLRPEKIKLSGGGVDLAPFQEAMRVLPDLNRAFAEAQQKVAGIDRSTLLPVVNDAIGQLLTVIDDTAPALKTVQQIMPTMLKIAGSDGKRTYLVIFQNNAEIRATGGNPAASMIVTVRNGQVKLLDQASSATFYNAGKQSVAYTKLPASAMSIYTRSTVSKHSQDFTMTPDFPTTATLFQNLWKHTNGSKFDGVISIDPVVLAKALSVAGPFTARDGTTITADNAVKALLSDSYARYPNGRDSDIFFADVASRAFSHLISPTWQPLKMLAVLQQAAAEQRIYLSFPRADEQALAVNAGLDGALLSNTKAKTQLGIYLNDYSVGKLEYYLKTSISATCNVPKRTVTVTMKLKSSVPRTTLTPYVLGLRNGTYGFSNRAMMIDVLFFAPPGAKILSTTPGQGDVASLARRGTEKGNKAVSETIAVQQGSSRTVAYTVKLPAGQLGAFQLRHTPTAKATTVRIASSCGQLMGFNTH